MLKIIFPAVLLLIALNCELEAPSTREDIPVSPGVYRGYTEGGDGITFRVLKDNKYLTDVTISLHKYFNARLFGIEERSDFVSTDTFPISAEKKFIVDLKYKGVLTGFEGQFVMGRWAWGTLYVDGEAVIDDTLLNVNKGDLISRNYRWRAERSPLYDYSEPQ